MIAGKTLLTCLRGDITKQRVDVIVNAANSSLLGGGGVDGAIHRTGGPIILAECQAIRARQGGCKTGEAVITGAGRLPAKFVVHAVGPVWQDGTHGEAELLAKTYRNSILLALDNGAATIAFPSISTGTFRYPIQSASRIAIDTVVAIASERPGLTEVRFVLFDDRDLKVYEKLL